MGNLYIYADAHAGVILQVQVTKYLELLCSILTVGILCGHLPLTTYFDHLLILKQRSRMDLV